LTACKSNLKNIGTAAEMYSTDHDGEYPVSLDELVPKHLDKLPECPAAEKMSYEYSTGLNAPYNTMDFEQFYFVNCQGENHTELRVGAGYPQYNGVDGLIER
jgi:hypothetical protein